VDSTHSVTETASAYAAALQAAGWTTAPAAECPTPVKGVTMSCWVLDRRELTILVATAPCAAPPPPSAEPGITELPPPATPSVPAGCAPTQVTISLLDRIGLSTAKPSPRK